MIRGDASGNPRALDVEIGSLTSIRGIAALWVVLLHSSAPIFRVLPEASFLKPLADAGHFAVPLFFILSGYVLGLRYLSRLESPTFGTILRFWWLRLGRIYPVHAVTLAISLLLVARHGWPTDPGHTVGRFVANCLLVHAWDYDFRLSWNYPSWSISSEWFAYLLFPAIAATLSGSGRRTATALVLIAFCLSILIYSHEDQVKFRGLAVVLPTFIGGVCLAIVCPPGGPTIRPRPWAGLGLLVAVVLPFVVGTGPFQVSLYFALFFALVGYLGLIGDRSSAFWRSRPLLYLGDISYSLYMTHSIIITLLARSINFDALGGRAGPARIAALAACLIAILGASSAMYHGVEWPFRELSRRRRAMARAAIGR